MCDLRTSDSVFTAILCSHCDNTIFMFPIVNNESSIV